MFKVKKRKTGEIVIVLDTDFDDIFHQTHFLIWDKDHWAWRPTADYIPPNWEEENGKL